MPESIREMLEESYNAAEEPEEEETRGSNEENTEESVGATQEEEGTEPNDSYDESDTDSDDTDTEDSSEESDEEYENEVAAVEASTIKPPASWKPTVREHWGKLPPEVQQEVDRRERQIAVAMQESAEARKTVDQFNETIRPFESIIAAQQSTPMEAIKNVMGTAAGLYMGSPQQKAAIVVDVIKSYGVDIGMLDQMLAGQVPQQTVDPNIENMLKSQLQPIQEFMNEVKTTRQTREQEIEANAETEITKFGTDPKNEFFDDVREDMADLMEIAAKRGREMTLQQAYDQACAMNPEIKSVLDGRNKKTDVQENNRRMGRKRRAASSVKGTPTSGSSGQSNGSIRGAIEEAWDDAQ